MSLFILKDVNFKNIINYPNIQINEGFTTFICGESGCGKSTLLKLLNGVISPTSGTIYYKNKNIIDYDPIMLRREILLVGQSAHLFDKTIRENFNEYYSYLDIEPPNYESIKKYLGICCTNLHLESDCGVLSGGERQRVFIAINLSLNSKVLMLDEPTSALDTQTADSLISNIISSVSDLSLIVVSHDKSIAEKYADNIITLGVNNPPLEDIV